MYLLIEDSMHMDEVQERFNDCFPQLSIVFYSGPFRRYASPENSFRIADNKCIREIRMKGINGAFEIKSWYPVKKVEETLHDIYGLHAQIFRNHPKGNTKQTSPDEPLMPPKQKK